MHDPRINQLAFPIRSHPIIAQLKKQLSQATVDIRYLETQQGQQHLKAINNELEQQNVFILFSQQNNQAHLSINLRIPTSEDRSELVPLLSFTRAINNTDNASYKLTRKELIKLKKCAAELGTTPSVVNPVVRKYIANQPLKEKIEALWQGEIIPGVKEIAADHIGKKIGTFILILLGYNQTNQENEEPENIAPELAHHLTLLQKLENLKNKEEELTQAHGEDANLKIYHNEEYKKLRDELITSIRSTKG